MKKDLLLVIDMQNVYIQGEKWYCPGIEKVAYHIKSLIHKKRNTVDVIFTRFLSPKEPVGAWHRYNRKNGSISKDIYANEMQRIFQKELNDYPLYTKSVYSSYAIPEVQNAVKKAGRVLVTGVVAECCILSTVMDLIDAGSFIIYLTDCIAGTDHESVREVEDILSGFEPIHLKKMTIEDYISEEDDNISLNMAFGTLE